MSKLLIVGIVALLGIGAYGFTKLPNASKDGDVTDSGQKFSTVSQEDSEGRAVLYDVRTPEEYATGHFTGAINFPLQDLELNKLPQVAKGSKIYIYCRSGNRSAQFQQLLSKQGYTNSVDLGGLGNVEAMGGKLIK